MTQAVLLTILILAGGGVLLLLVSRWLRARWLALVALALGLGAMLPFVFLRSGPLEMDLASWIPVGGCSVMLAYRFDTLSRAFALLAALPALLLLLWMGLGAPAEEGQFAPWVLLLLAFFLHLICSADLLLGYGAWEILLLGTYSLLVYRRAALPTPGIAEWFLGVQHLSGYPLVFALLLIGQPAGTLQVAQLGPGSVTPAALLLLLGAAWVRTAQVPFQGWATAAAGAPGPVSTLLLGGWNMLAGPYLWLRLASRVAEHTPREVALIAGSVSLLVGAVLALRQQSARRVQAGDTVSRLGLVWIALGLDGPLGVAAGLFLLLDFLLSKVAFHIALSPAEQLQGPLRRVIFALGVWGTVGLPPSMGFVGRWLLVMGLLQAGRLVYLPVVLLSVPLALAYLWRGWTLLPASGALASRVRAAAHRIAIGFAAFIPLAGLAAPWLWTSLLERATMAILETAAIELRPYLAALRSWVPAWTLLLLLIGAVVLWWSRAWRWRVTAADVAPSPTAGPLQEAIPVLPGETGWLAWVGRPVLLYRLFTYLAGYVVTVIHNLVRFLERHTAYFLLVVLVAATIVFIVMTR